MAITPCARSSSPRDASLLKAPRSLKELVTCRFSYFTKTSAPVKAESLGAGSIGVRSTCPAMVRRARSMSAIVTFMWALPQTRSGYYRTSCGGAIYAPPGRTEGSVYDERQRTTQDRRVDRRQAA